MDNKILTAAKKLKHFTLDDIVMMTDTEESIIKLAVKELIKNDKIKDIGKYFEYIEHPKNVENVKIINKSIEVKNSDITVLDAVKIFLQNCGRKN